MSHRYIALRRADSRNVHFPGLKSVLSAEIVILGLDLAALSDSDGDGNGDGDIDKDADSRVMGGEGVDLCIFKAR